MNRLICSISFLLLSCIGFSQKTFFVYIQSEGEQSFFVKMNDRNISSTPSGYVILSPLKDSIYNFRIGFPQNRWPEQDFSIAMSSNDHGFLLKNFNEKGWGLFDLQTFNVQMSGKKESAKIKTGPQSVSLFTEVLSRAANDPSLKERPVFAVQKEEAPSQEVVARQDIPTKGKDLQPEQKEKPADAIDKDSATGAVVISTNATLKDDPSKLQQENAQAQIAVKETQSQKRDTITTSSVTKRMGETKVDTAGKASEPVLADFQKEASQNVNPKKEPATLSQGNAQPSTQVIVKEKQPEKDTSNASSVVKNAESPKAETGNNIAAIQEASQSNKENNNQPQAVYRKSVVLKKSESSSLEGLGLVFIDQYPGGEKDTISIMIPDVAPAFKAEITPQAREKKFLNIDDPKETASSLTAKKNNCKAVASQNDFLKLRKKMAGQKDEEAMLEEAKKEFKTTCFSSEQVKNLGALFLKEPAKFQFYEAAYPYSSDPVSFAALQSELKDPYFIHRFKNMIK